MTATRVFTSQDVLGPERLEGRSAVNFLKNNPITMAATAAFARMHQMGVVEGDWDKNEVIEKDPEIVQTVSDLIFDLEGFSFLPFKDTFRIGVGERIPLTLEEMQEQFALKVKVAKRVYGEPEAMQRGYEAYLRTLQLIKASGAHIRLPTASLPSGLVIPVLEKTNDYMIPLHNIPPETDQVPLFNFFTAQRLRGIAEIHTPPPYIVTELYPQQ